MKGRNQIKQDLRILLLEDDGCFREQVVTLLGVYNDIAQAATIAQARTLLSRTTFDIVLLDKNLPDGNGLDLIPEIKAATPQTVVIILTADSNLTLVHKCLAAGASDYLHKGENIVPDLLVRIPMALSRASIERKSEQLIARFKQAFQYEIIGRSPAMAELRATVQSLKGSLTPVLISGETGTGKELIARRLHAVEDDPSRPFHGLNCAALPENLVESELFGHVRGAFSGATQDQVGKFVLADGGDLFLDEISDLPLNAQSKLLRVLQCGEVTPLGSTKTIQVNVRIIAAANKSLTTLVSQGKFRDDLYYRLNVYEIDTVPLRKHIEDIPDLVQFLLASMDKGNYSLTDSALSFITKQPWPGNVRDLRNTLERATILTGRRSSTLIERRDVETRGNNVLASGKGALGIPAAIDEVNPAAFKKFLVNCERNYLLAVLNLFDNNLGLTATSLGIGRTTLFRKMMELGLHKKSQTYGNTSPGLTTQTATQPESAFESEECL
ncbi:sigma-54 dependent transcriptional regulator [Bdellovibrionota bacterium FG-2]